MMICADINHLAGTIPSELGLLSALIFVDLCKFEMAKYVEISLMEAKKLILCFFFVA